MPHVALSGRGTYGLSAGCYTVRETGSTATATHKHGLHALCTVLNHTYQNPVAICPPQHRHRVEYPALAPDCRCVWPTLRHFVLETHTAPLLLQQAVMHQRGSLSCRIISNTKHKYTPVHTNPKSILAIDLGQSGCEGLVLMRAPSIIF